MISKIMYFFVLLFILITAMIHINRGIEAKQIFIKTPPDMEGPFYPLERQPDEDNDLTIIQKRNKHAKGEILNLSGIIIDINGIPVKSAVIEIWQTDPKGLYKHPNDNNIGERNIDFQYWGKNTTEDDGKFFFKTLIPGEYHPRSAHIHFKVWIKGKLILTSQMYLFRKTKNLNQKTLNELLKLYIVKTVLGDYEGFFRIVI